MQNRNLRIYRSRCQPFGIDGHNCKVRFNLFNQRSLLTFYYLFLTSLLSFQTLVQGGHMWPHLITLNILQLFVAIFISPLTSLDLFLALVYIGFSISIEFFWIYLSYCTVPLKCCIRYCPVGQFIVNNNNNNNNNNINITLLGWTSPFRATHVSSRSCYRPTSTSFCYKHQLAV